MFSSKSLPKADPSKAPAVPGSGTESVDIDSFLKSALEPEGGARAQPKSSMKATTVKAVPNSSLATIDEGEGIGDNSVGGGGHMSQRSPRVKIKGVTDVVSFTSRAAHKQRGRTRKREHVTMQDIEAAELLTKTARETGESGLVKALAKHAGVGNNDEAAAQLCDAIAAEIMGLTSVYQMGDEDDFLTEVHLLGVEPRDPTGTLKQEVGVKDKFVQLEMHKFILRALDKDCEERHVLSMLRALALSVVDLANPPKPPDSVSNAKMGVRGSTATMSVDDVKKRMKQMVTRTMTADYDDFSGNDSVVTALGATTPRVKYAAKNDGTKGITSTPTSPTAHKEDPTTAASGSDNSPVKKTSSVDAGLDKSLLRKKGPTEANRNAAESALKAFLHVHGDGRGEEVCRVIADVIEAHGDAHTVVAYALIVLAALGRVLGPEHGPRVLLKCAAPKFLTSALILQGRHWPCTLYALQCMLLPSGLDADGAAVSKESAKWLAEVAAAKCIPEIVDSVRHNATRLGVVELAVRLLLRLCAGKDSDSDRRRALAVNADVAPILLEVLNTNEMYEKCDRFFNEAALTKESRENFSQREVRRGGPAFALANKKTVFVTSLTVLELCCGGNSKVADERRIKLIGVIADEICDLLSSNRSSPPVQELGFRVLAAYSESNKRGVAEAFVEDLLAAGANVLACDLLAFTKAAKPLLGYPGPTSAAVRLVSNMCKSEAGDHAEEARHAFMSGNVPKFIVNVLKSNLANDASDKESAKLALSGCRAICNLASGFFPSDREKVLKAKGPDGVTAALLSHIDNPNVVAAACDALRVLTLATWRPPKGVPLKRPTLKDFVLDLHLGAAPSKEGRKAVLASKGHLAVCGALARKSVAAWDETAEDKKHQQILHNGPPPSLVQMWVSGARLLGTLASEEGEISDKARDELMTCNAHKIVIKAMNPLHELKQAARAMCACLEAVRHFAGCGEASTLLMRREIFVREGEVAVCNVLRAHPTDKEVQRQGLRCLRNMGFGGRDEGERHRNKMMKAEAHIRAATALRLYLTVEHELEKQYLSTSLHEAALGAIRNLAFGTGPGAEVRRAALFREKCDELVMLALAMTDKQILEAERRNLDPSDSVDAYRVGVVAIGNLVSGEGYVAENRRHDLVTRKEDHSPICDALAKYPKDANMQQACLVCLSNFMMGDGHGADLVRGAIVEHEVKESNHGNAGNAVRYVNPVQLCVRAMRRFGKDLQVMQAAMAFLTNLCIGTSDDSNEMRVIVLGEGAHELVLDAMAYFERKSEAKGLLLNRMGMAFLQNLTAGDGGHKPRQLLLSPGHLNFLDRFEDIMFTFAGDQVAAGHGVGLLGNLCIGWDDDEGADGDLPGAERRRQLMMSIDAPQLIGTVLRQYKIQAPIQVACFRAIAAFCEGKGPNSDARREACFKERLHVLVCEALCNPTLNAKRNESLLEAGRLAMGCIGWDSKKRHHRRNAIKGVMADYNLSMNTGWFVCCGQRSIKEYSPFVADRRFSNMGDEGDLFEETKVSAKHDFSKVDQGIAAEGGEYNNRNDAEGASEDVDSVVSSQLHALGGAGQASASKVKRRQSTSRFMPSPFGGKDADKSSKKTTPSMSSAQGADAVSAPTSGRKSSERQNPKPKGRKPKSETQDVSTLGPSGTIGGDGEEGEEEEEKTWGNLKQRLESKKREKMQQHQQEGAAADGASISGSASGSGAKSKSKSSAVRRPSLGRSQGSLGQEEFQRMRQSYVEEDISRGSGGGGSISGKSQRTPNPRKGGITKATHDEPVGVLGSEHDVDSIAGDSWADYFTGGRDTGTATAAAAGGKKKSSFEFGSIASSMVGKSVLAQRLEAKEAKGKSVEGENHSSKRRSSIGNGAANIAKGLLSTLVMTQADTEKLNEARAHQPPTAKNLAMLDPLSNGPNATLGGGDDNDKDGANSVASSFNPFGGRMAEAPEHDNTSRAARVLARRKARGLATPANEDQDGGQDGTSGGDGSSSTSNARGGSSGGGGGGSEEAKDGSGTSGLNDSALAVADPNDLEAILSLHHGAEDAAEKAKIAAEKADREQRRLEKTAKREERASRMSEKSEKRKSKASSSSRREDGEGERESHRESRNSDKRRSEKKSERASRHSKAERGGASGRIAEEGDGGGSVVGVGGEDDDVASLMGGSVRGSGRKSKHSPSPSSSQPRPPGMAPPSSLPPRPPSTEDFLVSGQGPSGMLGSENGDHAVDGQEERRESKRKEKKKSRKSSRRGAERESGRSSRTGGEVNALLAGMVLEEEPEGGENVDEAALEAMFRTSRASRGPKAPI